MKKILFAYMTVAFLVISCQNPSPSSAENTQTVQQVKDKFFYIEFVNLAKKNEYENAINLVKKELLNSGYVADKEIKNDWQGIRKIDKSEPINIEKISESHQFIHKFIDFSEYDSNNGDIQKIVININKPINDTIPNFNYRSYQKLGHEDWQSVFNPGNFRYKESNTFNESDLANWMIKNIVLLTFK